MSYQEKNTAVTLVSFSLILSYYLVNLLPRLEAGPLEPGPIYRLWITVVVLAILITVLGMILTHTGSAIWTKVRQGKDAEPETLADERDRLIDLKGDRTTSVFLSVGILASLITYASGQLAALGAFSVLVAILIAAQIAGDATRLVLYRKES